MYSFKVIIMNTSDNFITYILDNLWYSRQISFLKMYLDLVPIFLDYKKYSSTFWMNLLHHCFLKSQNTLSQKDSLETIFYSFEETIIVAESRGSWYCQHYQIMLGLVLLPFHKGL